MATQQEREAFLQGWRAAMDEVLASLTIEAREWKAEEDDASASGGYKLPGSFALEEVRGAFKGRRDLAAWISQNGPAAAQGANPSMARALEALIEGRATDAERVELGLTLAPPDTDAPPAEDDEA